MSLLETRELTKNYGDHVALDSLCLTVEQGEIVGLLGPNGAGKTTAISMICGVITPSHGTAIIDGADIRTSSLRARRAIGIVPQDLAVYEEITARQNLSFFGSLYELGRQTLKKRIAWALEVAGLSDRADEPVARFSGGMKRRLNLAAGLLHQPRLLILDEPTVGVDPQSRNYIFETIRSLQADHGMTVIYTSHYMEEVQSLCERVAILDHGVVIANDTVDNLVSSHGGGSLEIDVRGGMDEAVAAVAGLGEVTVDGTRLRVVPTDGFAPVVAAVESCAVDIRGLRTLEPDLETVFLTLTGHRLRDG